MRKGCFAGSAALAVAGAVAGLTVWLESPAPWLWVDVDPVDAGSATAIAPPALPTRRPVVSTQIPAARRSCVEIVVSSHQQAISSVGLSMGIVAQIWCIAITILQ